jgi:outer membrane lipoprotein SlyB
MSFFNAAKVVGNITGQAIGGMAIASAMGAVAAVQTVAKAVAENEANKGNDDAKAEKETEPVAFTDSQEINNDLTDWTATNTENQELSTIKVNKNTTLGELRTYAKKHNLYLEVKIDDGSVSWYAKKLQKENS